MQKFLAYCLTAQKTTNRIVHMYDVSVLLRVNLITALLEVLRKINQKLLLD